jgi:hypothetical protein
LTLCDTVEIRIANWPTPITSITAGLAADHAITGLSILPDGTRLGHLSASNQRCEPLRSLLTDTVMPTFVVDAQQIGVKKLRGAKHGPCQSETREYVSGVEHAGERAC